MPRMSGPKPGQIRCPTCHRSTPALETCTRCGSPIPPSARTRPRGLDRDELQARIRARRSGQPFRRGSTAADYALPVQNPAEPWTDDAWGDYEQHASAAEPVHQGAGGWQEPVAARWDDSSQLPEPPRQPAEYDDNPTVRGPSYDADYGEQPSWEPLPYDQSAPTDLRYRVREEYEERHRPRSSAGPLLVLGFISLGALALFGGAMLAGIFGRDPDRGGDVAAVPTSEATQSLTPVATRAPTPPPTATDAPAGSEGPAPSSSPGFAFEDGFRAQASPCIGEPISPGVCPSSGEVVSAANGSVWILVNFEDIQGGDLIGARGVDPDGVPIGDASWEAGGPGNGWAYFAFNLAGLADGEYEVTVTRNGRPAAMTEFRIEN